MIVVSETAAHRRAEHSGPGRGADQSEPVQCEIDDPPSKAPFNGEIDAEVLQAYDRALEELARLGARLERARLPHAFAEYLAGAGGIMAAEGYHAVGALAEDAALPLDPHVRARILLGRDVTARDYLETLRQQAEDQRAYAAAFGMVQRQASMLSFVELFRGLGVMFLLLVPLVMLMKRPRSSAGAAAAH